MIKINKLESTLCNDCRHTANNEGICIDWSFHLEDSSNVQTASGTLHQLMDPRGEYLKMADIGWMSKAEYISKSCLCDTVISALSDALIYNLT